MLRLCHMLRNYDKCLIFRVTAADLLAGLLAHVKLKFMNEETL